MLKNLNKFSVIKKTAVIIIAVFLAVSFCAPSSIIIRNSAHAEPAEEKLINGKKVKKVNGHWAAAEEIIIKYKSDITNEQNSIALNEIDPSYETLSSKNTVKIKVPEGKTLEEYIAELNANGEIAFAQPNYLYTLDATVDDPYTDPSAGANYQWYHDMINTFEAWDYATGTGITVAIIDTGVDTDHEDLVSQITSQYDYYDENADAEDDNGHGTHVAGIVAAQSNTLGGAGIAPNSSLMILDVFFKDADTGDAGAYTTDIIEGIDHARINGADVINMSLGSYQDPESTEYWDLAFEAAVDTAVASGVVVVSSAGNDAVSDGAPDYAYHRPSDYDTVISVISTDSDDSISSFSNYGPLKDISAPGGYIVSTYFGGGYAALSGTSMASPVVAGVVALILSADPTLTVDEVKNILYSTVDDLGAEGKDDYYGWGRVNAEAAVRMALDMVYKMGIDQDTATVEIDRSVQLNPVYYPSTATNKNVTWSSGNEAVATVDASGNVTGVSLGTATITVTSEDGGYQATCDITVEPVSVTGVTLDRSAIEIIIGGDDTLVATVAPADAANKNVTWSSDNEAVATVTQGGFVQSVSIGTANITVTTEDGSHTAACVVTVSPIPADGVTLNKTSVTLYEGASTILKATVSPNTAANKNVTWTSNNPSAVTVDTNGMITAVAAGSATITVTTESGGHTDTCTVTVSTLSPVTVDETIKVKLSIGSVTTLPIYVDGNYSVLGGSGDALERQQYHVDVEGSVLKLYYGSTEIASGTSITLTQHEATTGNNFIWMDNTEHGDSGYLGDMVFTISGGYIQAVNHVYIEDYLYGVVPHEMSNSWPVEALKAQAIAARTYAASNIGGGSYDVVDTSSDQVYEGYDATLTNAIAAVDATGKQVLQYGNSLIIAYYAASNGGYTDIPYHVWGSGTDMPYEIFTDSYDVANSSSPYEMIHFPAVIDGGNPVTVSDNVDGTPSITNAVSYIKQRILDSGQLAGVTSVSQFELTGVLNLAPHTYDTDGGSEDHSRVPPIGDNDCVDYVMATGTFTVSVGGGANQEVSSIELDLRYFDAANGITTYQVFNFTSLRLFVIEGDSVNGWSIYHRRYGHGVGMSQRGAQQRANNGQDYNDILAFYYPNTSRVTLSYTQNALTSNTPATDDSNAEISVSDYLNVRLGPGTEYTIVGTLPNLARVNVTSAYSGGGDWHMITFGGINAYVHSDYVTLDAYVEPTGVSLDQSAITLAVSADQTLVATVSPSNASNKNVTWQSSNTDVATVDANGKVTAVAEGSATITVTTEIGSHTDTCDVTVVIPVTGVSLNKSSTSLSTGKTETLVATITPSDATNQHITWTSDNEAAATVVGGVVTAEGVGSATITAETQDGGFTATCTVTVTAPPTDAIYSSIYTVDQANSLLLGVPNETTLEAMIGNLSNAASDIKIIGTNSVEITDLTRYTGTGMKVQLVIDSSVVDELDIVVLGDVDGDGTIFIIDYAIIKSHLNLVTTLTGIKYIAADVYVDGNLDILDYAKMKSHLNGIISIN